MMQIPKIRASLTSLLLASASALGTPVVKHAAQNNKMDGAIQARLVSVAFSIHGSYPQSMTLVSSGQKMKVTKKFGTIKILENMLIFEPVYLVDDRNRTLAVSYFSPRQKSLIFSPEQSAKSLVIMSPFSAIKPEASRIRFLKALNEVKYKSDLQKIMRSFDRTGIVTTDGSIELAIRLSMKISQEIDVSY